MYKCSSCEATFKRHHFMLFHLQRDNCANVCPKCKLKPERLERHLQTCCKCKQCSLSFDVKLAFDQHVLICNKGKLVCEYCSKEFKHKSRLEKHQLVCCICKNCSTRIKLDEFKLHLETCLKCPTCERTFKQQARFETHKSKCNL